MYVADALSRAYLNESSENQWHSEFGTEVQEINMTKEISVADPLLDEIKRETTLDLKLQGVKNGRPDVGLQLNRYRQ